MKTPVFSLKSQTEKRTRISVLLKEVAAFGGSLFIEWNDCSYQYIVLSAANLPKLICRCGHHLFHHGRAGKGFTGCLDCSCFLAELTKES